MNLDAFGRLQAVKNHDGGERAPARVCPFSAEALDEDALAEEFLGATPERCGEIGRYRSLYAAHVRDPEGRARGSSGGVATWVLSRLLESGEVDGVLHVRPREATAEDKRLFAYAVSRSVEELRAGAKSHYYPVEMSEVLRTVAETPGRYAVAGLPCFIKAVRLLMREDAVLAERVVCCIGLVCGGLKSAAYAECLAWQCGVVPGALRRLDFRVKLDGRRADDYGFEANGAVAPVRGLLGADWGLNFFSYGACDFCDDVFAETADLSIGDAWLRRYARDGLGTNLLVLRGEGMERLINEGVRTGALATTALTEKEAVRSQGGGLFNRRSALAWRLYRAERAGRWHPPKRVRSDARALGRRERRKHLLRSLLGMKSGMAFRRAAEAGNFEAFRREMAPWVARYGAVARPWWRL
jgi:coenzyme F420-reducing hydrogenase beta subunit